MAFYPATQRKLCKCRSSYLPCDNFPVKVSFPAVSTSLVCWNPFCHAVIKSWVTNGKPEIMGPVMTVEVCFTSRPLFPTLYTGPFLTSAWKSSHAFILFGKWERGQSERTLGCVRLAVTAEFIIYQTVFVSRPSKLTLS